MADKKIGGPRMIPIRAKKGQYVLGHFHDLSTFVFANVADYDLSLSLSLFLSLSLALILLPCEGPLLASLLFSASEAQVTFTICIIFYIDKRI